MRPSKLLLVIAVVFGLVASGVSVKELLRSAVGRSGRVVQITGGPRCGVPVVQFQDEKGASHRFEGGTCSRPPAYAVGEAVAVAYAPGDPSSASIDSFLERWLIPVAFSVVAVGCAIGWAVARGKEGFDSRRS